MYVSSFDATLKEKSNVIKEFLTFHHTKTEYANHKWYLVHAKSVNGEFTPSFFVTLIISPTNSCCGIVRRILQGLHDTILISFGIVWLSWPPVCVINHIMTLLPFESSLKIKITIALHSNTYFCIFYLL